MEQAKLSEANYPETLRRVFIINGTSITIMFLDYIFLLPNVNIDCCNSPEDIYHRLQNVEIVP